MGKAETADARETRIFRLLQRSEKRANALEKEAEGLQERVSALREALIELEGSYERSTLRDPYH